MTFTSINFLRTRICNVTKPLIFRHSYWSPAPRGPRFALPVSQEDKWWLLIWFPALHNLSTSPQGSIYTAGKTSKKEKRRNMLMIYIIQTFSIFKSYTSCIVFPFRAILEELILRIGPASGAIFSLLPSRWSNTWVRIDPVQNSVEAALENTHEQERNTIKVKELNLKS